MPAIRTYVVTRTQEVKVSCETVGDAVRVGEAAFEKEDHDFRAIGGLVVREVRTIATDAREDR